METTEVAIGWRNLEGEALRPPLQIVEQLQTALETFYFEQMTYTVVVPLLKDPVHPAGTCPEVTMAAE
jgi:hypothetical protein